MKVLIVDNEIHLRKGLKLLLENYCPEVTDIAEANGVKTGLNAISTFNPDILLLDVEMDDGTGFDLMKQIQEPEFQLIFVTAHNKYAIDAFQFSAIDYLLKPFISQLPRSNLDGNFIFFSILFCIKHPYKNFCIIFLTRSCFCYAIQRSSNHGILIVREISTVLFLVY